MAEPITSQTATVATGAGLTVSGTPNRLSSASDEGRFLPGTLVAGRYRVISLLGRGGMGEVYRATDLTLAQPVALKFLPETGPDVQRTLERFHNEVRVARQVSHPNVCRVYDLGEVDGMPYISMEYVDGEDLESLLRRIGRLPAAKAVEIARKIAAGVAAAHAKGVIHRDLKPANIMLDKRGNAVVMDFGLAAVAEQLHGLEARSGTPAYMSPEQLRGEEVTAKSDIYALGLVLYELFTGRRAFEAKSHTDLIRLEENIEIASMSSLAPDIEPAVEKTVRRCLDPDPARRPSSALSVAMSLPGGDPLAAALAAGETPSPELVAASGKTQGLPLRRSVPLAVAVVFLIAAAPLLRRNSELHTLTPMNLPPEALAAKAREYAAAFGYTTAPADWKYDLHWMSGLIREAGRGSKSIEENRSRIEAEPPLQLGYRESPLPLVAKPDGEITEERPAPLLSGMIEAWVNSKGELRRFQAVPPQIDAPSASPPPVDTSLIARSTGFDISTWEDTAPKFTPLYASDWQRAWKGKHPGLNTDVLIEASAWHGRITELNVVWPWTKAERMAAVNARPQSDLLFQVLLQVTSGITFLVAAFLAVRNFRAGRGDRKGASRFALATATAMAIAWICRAHWMLDIAMWNIVIANGAIWVMNAALLWLLYIALEPAVRSRWPHSLVTWNRVLAGRWNDALVGSHVLYGALTGLAIQCFFMADAMWSVRLGQWQIASRPQSGMSSRSFLADVLTMSWEAAETGLVVVFAIFCLRTVCRKDWIASLTMAVLLTLREAAVWSGGAMLFVVYAAIFALLAFVLLRLGLLATIVAILFVNLLDHTPGAQDLTKWYEWAVVAYPALELALVLWAFWRTSGEQALRVES